MSIYPAPLDQLDARTLDLLEQRRRAGKTHRRGWLVRRALLGADLVGLATAFLISEWLFAHHGPAADRIDRAYEFLLFFLTLPAWVVAAKLYGLYDQDEERTDHSTVDDFARVFHLVTVVSWLLYAGAYVTSLVAPNFPKLMVFWALAVTSVPLARAGGRSYCRRQIQYLQNTIIVGAGDVGQSLARKLLKHPEFGLNLVGFADSSPRERDPALEHIAILGSLENVPRLVRLLDIERVIFAFSEDTHGSAIQVVRALNDLDVQVDIVPRFFEVLGAGVDIHSVEGVSVIGLRPARLSTSSRLIKRTVDVIGSISGLVALAPLLMLSAALIKLDSRGPVFFRQWRVGAGDELFRIWKFRTMIEDADARKHELAHLNKHLDDDPRMFKIDGDPRVTRVGRWLRRYSIDELPQLVNVLVGDMSLVGPRPLIVEESHHVKDWAQRRLDLRPGITGLWQVLGRDAIPFEEMVRLDYLYVTGWSLGGDLRLLLKTVPAVLGSHDGH